MTLPGRPITALLVAPNRELADQFAHSLAKSKNAFQIILDLKSYPNQQTLEMRLRQMRPDVLLLDLTSSLEAACDLIRFAVSQKIPLHVVGLHLQNDSEAILRSLRVGASEFLHAPFDAPVQQDAMIRIQKLVQPDNAADREMGK